MKNIGCIIASHNCTLLHPPEVNCGCNCLDRFNCILDKQYLTPNVSL